nr:M1 family metallopeptidase [uncultured Ralstonia sp.]
MRDSTTIRRAGATGAKSSPGNARRSFKLALVAQAAAAMMILAACGGGADDALTPAGGKLGANGSQQQGNTSTGNTNAAAPAVDASVPPVELPDYIRPVNYKLWFRPSADLNSFSGRADVEIKVTKQTGAVTLAVRDLKLDASRLTLTPTSGNGASRVLVPIPQSQGAFYDLRDPTSDIKPGNYVLHMEWTGTINFTKAEGIFKLGLQAATGESSDAIVTQGESNFAREWFPSWDEPAFRNTFEVTAEIPGDWKAVANGKQTGATKLPDGYQQVSFAKTPSMPAYLLFFGGGKFDILEDKFTNPLDGSSMRLRWWVPPGEAHSAVAGMQFTKEALNHYYNYFQIPLPFDKMDTIVANDSYNNKNAGFGGMENWGAIFEFADQVLVPPDGTPTTVHSMGKARSFVVVSHELAHQWFGDLVTLDWWDDIWLNESFANWFENVTKIALHPEFQGNTWQDYAAVKQRVITLDLQPTAVPVQHNLSDAGSMDFLDRFAYNKGGHVLQMLENYIGEDAMRRGLQSYLNKYKFGNGTPPRLWAELEAASGKPVGKVGDSFVRQTGVPLVSIDAQCNPATNQNVLTISQRAFPNKNVYSGYQWNVPLTLAYGDNFGQTQTIVLDQQTAQVTLPTCSAVLANPSGLDYYVTSYSPTLWSTLLAQAGAISNDAAKTNIAGDATQLYNAQLITKAQYDQIVGIKNFQPAVATLAAQSVKPTGSLRPQAVQLQEMQSMDRPIHTFRYEGLMKHLTDIKR